MGQKHPSTAMRSVGASRRALQPQPRFRGVGKVRSRQDVEAFRRCESETGDVVRAGKQFRFGSLLVRAKCVFGDPSLTKFRANAYEAHVPVPRRKGCSEEEGGPSTGAHFSRRTRMRLRGKREKRSDALALVGLAAAHHGIRESWRGLGKLGSMRWHGAN